MSGSKGRWGPLAVGLVAFALTTVFVLVQLSKFDWDPTHFVAFGEDSGDIRVYAEDRLGTVALRPDLGHDGRFFFVQANDPWILHPAENAYILDRPIYRSQRMLYPALASGFGALGPETIVFGMLFVNLVAMGLGSWAVAWIAAKLGGSVWWGLAFVLNVGLISELDVGGAGVVACAAAFGALAFLLQGRVWAGVGLLIVSALSREVMLIAAVGAALYMWRREGRRQAILALVVPVSAVVIWATYLQIRLTVDSRQAEVQEIGVPFVGLIQAFESWMRDPVDLAMGLVVLVLLGLFVRRAILQDNIVGWAFLGFVPLALVLTEQVWHSYYDITRAMAPLLTAFALLVGVGDTTHRRNQVGVGSSAEAIP